MDKETKINEMEITDEFLMADVNESVEDIAKKLGELQKETDHGAVLITEEERKVIGFITKKEIVDLIAADKDFSGNKAADIMNKDFMEVKEDETLGNMIPDISKQYPNSIVVINPEGECVGYFSRNDYSDALAGLGVYDKTHKPKSKDDWRTKGIAMSSLGKKIEALKCFEKSVEKRQDKEKGWSELAKRLERINRLKDSIMCYDKVLSINSENEEALTKKGELYSQENTENLAIQNYKKALEVNPDNVNTLTNLSMEQANTGEIEDAMENLDKAVALEGETPELWFKKGNIYDKAKKYEDALDCFNNAIKMNDYYEEAWYNKGITLNKLGKDDDAVQCLAKILQINPNNESARETLNTYRESGSLKMF